MSNFHVTTVSHRALVDALREALGDESVTDCERGDGDPRTAQHVSGRAVGRPLCWVRPASTEACAAAVRVARAHGAPVCPVGDATTFWDGLRVEGAIALDVTALRSPLTIDRARRLAWAGAGCSVRAIDRAARALGLCLAAYPDASGDTPVGTLVAIGTTAGVGMGRALPIEQVTGATAVLGSGEIVRVGASHALGGPPFMRHGLPDLLGLMTAAEGRAALLTEIGLALVPAPHCVQGRIEGRLDHAPDADDVLSVLATARRALDRGALDTFRLELGSPGDEEAVQFEVLFRSFSHRGATDAHDEAARLRSELQAALGKAATLEAETARGRAGELPEYDARFSVPPGQHRARVEGGSFWGAEVATSWGDDLRGCLARLLSLHHDLARLRPLHRRLGVYPASHSVSVGVQALGRGGEQRAAELAAQIAAALPDLLAAGGVPYRAGNLWHQALAARLGSASDAPAAIERCLRALDPDGVLPGPRGLSQRGEHP
jgi:FAD/FMN-containing dehydrogenase